jgi:hypothetical protein
MFWNLGIISTRNQAFWAWFRIGDMVSVQIVKFG